MLLAHLFIAEHKALSDLNVPINGNFNCSYHDGEFTLYRGEDTTTYYQGHHCSALIGPNGVGKSSILEVLELLTARTDSRAFVIFYDDPNDHYFICGINMDMDDVVAVHTNSPHTFVANNEIFLSRNNLNLIKINNLPADDGLLRFSSGRPGKYVRELTVGENVKTSNRRKVYFEKLLNYFSDAIYQDEFMEEVAFAFTFSSSQTSILQRTIGHPPLDHDTQIERVQEWYRRRSPLVQFGDDANYAYVFQSLVELNALSILSALASDSELAKKKLLPYLLLELVEVDFEVDESMSVSNRLQHMLRRFRSGARQRYPIDSEAGFSEEAISFAVNKMEGKLEEYLKEFANIAEVVCDHCFDGESLNLNRVITTDYYVIQKLTGLIGSLPANIAANMKWGWRGISSGEQARTHIFAEIHAYLKCARNSNNIILIDEADLYLHPEWQRTLLHDLLRYLNEMKHYHHFNTPQIIICTHSPIIISDFLPDNIVSLRKAEDGQTKVTEPLGFGNTIGDIYLKGMHLRSTFGEHARKMLDRIIFNRREGNLSSEDTRLIDKISNIHVRNFLLSHDQDQ